VGSSVSVIIPCYNYGHYLERCVASVLTQIGVDVQVLIIDDCSDDDTPAIGAMLAHDPRVTFRRHQHNMRHLRTYNEGLEWATGDYTVLLSADDLLVHGALLRAASFMDAHPNVGMTYGRSIYFQSNDDLPRARSGTPQPVVWDGSDWIARRCKTATNCISSPEVMMRTSVQKQVGGYRLDLPHSGDLEMWLRVAAHAQVAYLAKVDQAYYRVHAHSMMRTTFHAALADLQQRKAAFDALFRDHGQFVRDGARDQWLANKALAREALWTASRAFDRRRIGEVPVDDLIAFALATYTDARALPEFWGLQLRRRIGPRWCPWLQPLMFSAVVHRGRDRLWWRRWQTSGV
jgi:Glycosyl transferase family 2